MGSQQTALLLIHEIEAAVAEGDLELANSAVQNLKPLLVNNKLEELLALRKRIENLTIGVRALRDQDANSLIQFKLQRGGAATYQQMQSRS